MTRRTVRCRLAATGVALLAPALGLAQGLEAPPATVEAPPPLTFAELPEVPSRALDWTFVDCQGAPLGYQIDLDLVAPLGSGAGNLADWLDPWIDGGPKGRCST